MASSEKERDKINPVAYPFAGAILLYQATEYVVSTSVRFSARIFAFGIRALLSPFDQHDKTERTIWGKKQK